jgi:hypothetical protein
MVKVYLDWNVINQMKRGLFPELHLFLKENNDAFLVFYSTAHINDILTGYNINKEQSDFIEGDLEFISEVTRGFCFLNTLDNRIIQTKKNPKELFRERVEEGDILSNFSLDKIGEYFDDSDLGNIVNSSINFLKDIPLPFNKNFSEAQNNPNIEKDLDRMLPGIRENPTMGGFFDSFLTIRKQMDESDEYKELRKDFQDGLNINRDKAFNWKEPFKELNKIFLHSSFGQDHQGFINQIRGHQNENRTWLDKFVEKYLILDMAGFQEDEVKIKKAKKKTFRNTLNDALHAAFASQCDYYVLNDKRGEFKTKAVYNHFEIGTKVFKPFEFIAHIRQKSKRSKE